MKQVYGDQCKNCTYCYDWFKWFKESLKDSQQTMTHIQDGLQHHSCSTCSWNCEFKVLFDSLRLSRRVQHIERFMSWHSHERKVKNALCSWKVFPTISDIDSERQLQCHLKRISLQWNTEILQDKSQTAGQIEYKKSHVDGFFFLRSVKFLPEGQSVNCWYSG